MQISTFIKLILASYVLEEWNDYLSKILSIQPVFCDIRFIPINLILSIKFPASTPQRIDLATPVSRRPVALMEQNAWAAGVDSVRRTIRLSTSRHSRGLSWLQVKSEQ